MVYHPAPAADDLEDTQFELPHLRPSTSSVLREYRQQSAASATAPPPPPTTTSTGPQTASQTSPQTAPQTTHSPFPGLSVYPVKIADFNIDEIQINVSKIRHIFIHM